MILAPDEGEALAEFEDHRAQMFDQPALQIALQHVGAEREEVEGVGVFENLLGKLGLRGRQGS
jgi:hypothetical protein